jgi:ketosteroid isomerase-like protein
MALRGKRNHFTVSARGNLVVDPCTISARLPVSEPTDPEGCTAMNATEAQRKELLRSLYRAFNARDIDTVLAAMTEDVDWPNGWEGGRIIGHDGVRDYWERQWAAIDPTVEPTAIDPRDGGDIEVTVRQVVRDGTGTVLADGAVRHVYAFRGDLIQRMDIPE